MKQEQHELPACMVRQSDGVYVDLSKAAGNIEGAIIRVFEAGARFCGLDYGLLTALLYDNVFDMHDRTERLKLAEDIADFPAERRALYKAVKMDADKQHAEYFFEPPSITVNTEEPVHGDAGKNGPVLGMAKELQPTKLDIDEFIADMWLKGVRYGIDVEAVKKVMEKRETVRMIIASQRDATEGIDAEIEEACNVLHRDNSPKLQANGKADLRRFQNRFPQIASGAHLLKKKPRVPGKPGYKVSGEMILPRVPLDEIDLQSMAGPGTHVEFQEGCEYILASQDGFLSLDMASNNISVTEKIENKGGVSIKTTGDLSLAGNEFIEHGEVQEGRLVEGRNMTFLSNVYGDVVSLGGIITLEKNISGGSAKSQGGDVISNGRAFNAVIEACTGKVTLKYAESCLILGRSVSIERAVNCDIVASEVDIGSAEGCSIAGKQVRINSSSACRSKETIVSMILPDFSSLDAQALRIEREAEDCHKVIETKLQELELLKKDAEFAKYLALASSIKQGKIQLSATQLDAWKKMTARFAGSLNAMSQLNKQSQAQLTELQELQQEKEELKAMREQKSGGISCNVSEVTGETLVRGLVEEIHALQKYAASEIRTRLRAQNQKRIFSGDHGSLAWTMQAGET